MAWFYFLFSSIEIKFLLQKMHIYFNSDSLIALRMQVLLSYTKKRMKAEQNEDAHEPCIYVCSVSFIWSKQRIGLDFEISWELSKWSLFVLSFYCFCLADFFFDWANISREGSNVLRRSNIGAIQPVSLAASLWKKELKVIFDRK